MQPKIFGTITWKNRQKRKEKYEGLRREDFEDLINMTRAYFHLRSKDIKHFVVMEPKEDGGNCHYHFLISKLGLEDIEDNRMAQVLTDNWIRKQVPRGGQRGGMGTAIIEPFRENIENRGLSYLCKFLGTPQVDRISYYSSGLMRFLKTQNVPNANAIDQFLKEIGYPPPELLS